MKVREVIRLLTTNDWRLDRVRRRYTVIIEKGETNWDAYAPDVPGCGVVADTRAEVERLIAEALVFHFEGLLLAGEMIPEPVSDAITIDVPIPELSHIA